MERGAIQVPWSLDVEYLHVQVWVVYSVGTWSGVLYINKVLDQRPVHADQPHALCQ